MSTSPLIPRRTAVWLVENTALSFDQIAQFCNLHPLEVKAIADGDAAQGIKGLDPVLTSQLTREQIEQAEADPELKLRLTDPKVRLPQPKSKKGPRYTPVSRRQDRPNAILWLVAQPSRAQGQPDHAARRHHQVDDRVDPRAYPLERPQPAADGPGDARPLLADRSRPGGAPRRQGEADRPHTPRARRCCPPRRPRSGRATRSPRRRSRARNSTSTRCSPSSSRSAAPRVPTSKGSDE